MYILYRSVYPSTSGTVIHYIGWSCQSPNLRTYSVSNGNSVLELRNFDMHILRECNPSVKQDLPVQRWYRSSYFRNKDTLLEKYKFVPPEGDSDLVCPGSFYWVLGHQSRVQLYTAPGSYPCQYPSHHELPESLHQFPTQSWFYPAFLVELICIVKINNSAL